MNEESAQSLFCVALERSYGEFDPDPDHQVNPDQLRSGLMLSRLDAVRGGGGGYGGPPGGMAMGPMPAPPAGNGTMLCILSADWDVIETHPHAGFWPILCERVDAILKEASNGENARLDRELAVAEHQLAEASARLQQLAVKEQELRGRAGLEQLRLDRVLEWQGQLRERVLARERELKVLEAQEAGILQQINRMNEEVEKTADPVAAELEKVVAAREAAADRVHRLAEAGQASHGEMERVQAEVAEAKVRLLHRQEERRAMAGAEMVGDLKRRLTEVAIESQQTQAELESLRQELEAMESRNVIAVAAEYEREIGTAPEYLRDQMRMLQQQVDMLRTKIAARQTPSVTILGGP